jgi:hypothetical protein
MTDEKPSGGRVGGSVVQLPDQKPSVGRIVHYHYPDAGPIAAIVTAVNKDGTCELTLFHAHPNFSATIRKSDVLYAVGPRALHWNWPPRV